jgi:small ubiquitin-related modifier
MSNTEAQAANTNTEIIHLKVRSQVSLILLLKDDDEVFFKIKRSTQLKKLMDKYCERQGISNPQNVRFLFDGERVLETNTPDEVV